MAGSSESSTFPQTLADALPSAETVKSARQRLEKAGVEIVMSSWIDICGLPKTKPVPLREFENLCAGRGPEFAVHSVSEVPMHGPADPDQVPVPDLNSLTVCPWDHRYAWVAADLFHEGRPFELCPRLILKRQVSSAAAEGYRYFTGVEPEFIVMTYDDRGRPVKAFEDDPRQDGAFRPKRQAFGYDVEFSLNSMPFLQDVIAAMDELGWGLKNVVCEGGYSQYELDFGFSDPVTMADRFCFLRVMLKEIAKRHDAFVTYMPKPTQGDWRSGAHINHSVTPVDEPDRNLLKGADGWSETTFHALGGLMRHGGALTCISCSTVNSYKGLIGRASGFEGGTVTWAPTHMTYGYNNRSAMLRLPQNRYAIENRAVDMCMNAHLALAFTMAATTEGIREKVDAGKPTDVSLYDTTEADLAARGVHRLPRTLLEAVDLFDADPLVREVLGEQMHTAFSRYKHQEWDRFHEHVTAWEQREYLRYF